jgi:GT2 family glycosyltransferase
LSRVYGRDPNTGYGLTAVGNISERILMTKTAIVILNWNGLKFLQMFLAKVVANTLVRDTAIWLVDNGSTDDSAEWVRQNIKEVNIIEFEKNLGYAGGYAMALEMIEAEYFLLLNSDIEVSPGWLEPLVSHMESNVRTAACQPKILSYYKRTHFEYAGASGGFIDRFGYPFCRGRILNLAEEDKGQYDDTLPVFWASGACIIVRASAYREVGGLDPEFFAHMEEIDLCWRFHNRGYNVFVIPESIVFHVGGGTLRYDTPGKHYLNFRNNLFMLYKNLPGKNFSKTLFIRKLLDGMAAITFLLGGKPRHFAAVLRAHRDYYRAGKRLRDERKKGFSERGINEISNNLRLNKSILFLFYFRRLRKYSDLPF